MRLLSPMTIRGPRCQGTATASPPAGLTVMADAHSCHPQSAYQTIKRRHDVAQALPPAFDSRSGICLAFPIAAGTCKFLSERRHEAGDQGACYYIWLG